MFPSGPLCPPAFVMPKQSEITGKQPKSSGSDDPPPGISQIGCDRKKRWSVKSEALLACSSRPLPTFHFHKLLRNWIPFISCGLVGRFCLDHSCLAGHPEKSNFLFACNSPGPFRPAPQIFSKLLLQAGLVDEAKHSQRINRKPGRRLCNFLLGLLIGLWFPKQTD